MAIRMRQNHAVLVDVEAEATCVKELQSKLVGQFEKEIDNKKKEMAMAVLTSLPIEDLDNLGSAIEKLKSGRGTSFMHIN